MVLADCRVGLKGLCQDLRSSIASGQVTDTALEEGAQAHGLVAECKGAAGLLDDRAALTAVLLLLRRDAGRRQLAVRAAQPVSVAHRMHLGPLL